MVSSNLFTEAAKENRASRLQYTFVWIFCSPTWCSRIVRKQADKHPEIAPIYDLHD